MQTCSAVAMQVAMQADGASTAAVVAEVVAAVATLQAQRAAQAQRLAALEAATACARAGLSTVSAAGEAAAERGRAASPAGAAERARLPALQGALGAAAERAGTAAPPAAEAAPERACPHAAGAAAEPAHAWVLTSASAVSDGAARELEAVAQRELWPEAATEHRRPCPQKPAAASGRAPAPPRCHADDAAAAHVLAGADAHDSGQAPASPGAAGHALAAEQGTAERQRQSALVAAAGRKHPPAREPQHRPVLEAAAEPQGSSPVERAAAPLETPGAPSLACQGCDTAPSPIYSRRVQPR